MWEKLAWDIDVFGDIQRDFPEEKQPLVYAALNVCISAISLRDWLKLDRSKVSGRRISPEEWEQHLRSRIPNQKLCEDIANTAKHGAYRGFQSTVVTWVDGGEDHPSGHIMYFELSESQERLQAYAAFTTLLAGWWKYLVQEGKAKGRQPLPCWHQNKLKRIFGPVPSSMTE